MQKSHLVNIPQICRLQLETAGVHVQLTFHEVVWRLVSCVKIILHAAVAGDSIQLRRVSRRNRPQLGRERSLFEVYIPLLRTCRQQLEAGTAAFSLQFPHQDRIASVIDEGIRTAL